MSHARTIAIIGLLSLACGESAPAQTKTQPQSTASPIAAQAEAAPNQNQPAPPSEPASARALAAPNEPKPAPPSKAEREQSKARFGALLDEGRKLSKQGNHAAAQTKLREALTLHPGHGGALGELGWSAFQAGDLALAERSTLAALNDADDNRRRAALLYNLGRIQQARGQEDDAASYYRDSLALRPNATVETQLAALNSDDSDDDDDDDDDDDNDSDSDSDDDGGDSSWKDDPDDLCTILLSEFAGGEFDEGCSCSVGKRETAKSGPWSEVATLDTIGPGDQLWIVELAVHEARGWRRLTTVVDEEAPWTDFGGQVDVAFEELTPDSPGPELRVDVLVTRTELTGDDDDDTPTQREAYTIICGSAPDLWCVTLPRERDIPKPFAANLKFDGNGHVDIETTDPSWSGRKRLRDLRAVSGFTWIWP
ncbi:tetratricopeptide repeat protein [Pseudenhygromyxa sp. WMMC2535]|uniref:tetratricopeptide repeat protein n=1 Tax=Pseudenhygromyxa sp. WMMC2535 TaxID=2712867 RepID=UPI0015577120|nr:tetratricopeptide repeat protein [Pseudenhygromyxa sp. WMMC2535]NVB39573.1 tetratricopeptide repeat protein [Pseudenhygromyxa sp. WMMC2535]